MGEHPLTIYATVHLSGKGGADRTIYEEVF